MDYHSKFELYSILISSPFDKSKFSSIIDTFFSSHDVKRISYPYLIDSNLDLVKGFNLNISFNLLKPYEKVVVMDLVTLLDMKLEVVTFDSYEPWRSSHYDPLTLKRYIMEYSGNETTMEYQGRILEIYSYIFVDEFNKKSIEERLRFIGESFAFLKSDIEKMVLSLLPKIDEENQRLVEDEIREVINKQSSKEGLDLVPELKDPYIGWQHLVEQISQLQNRIRKSHLRRGSE